MDPVDTRSFTRTFLLPNGNVLEISFKEGVYSIDILDCVLHIDEQNSSDLISFDNSRDIHLKFPAFRGVRFERQSLPSGAISNLSSSIPQDVGAKVSGHQMSKQQIPISNSNQFQNTETPLRNLGGKLFARELPSPRETDTFKIFNLASQPILKFYPTRLYGRPIGEPILFDQYPSRAVTLPKIYSDPLRGFSIRP